MKWLDIILKTILILVGLIALFVVFVATCHYLRKFDIQGDTIAISLSTLGTLTLAFIAIINWKFNEKQTRRNEYKEGVLLINNINDIEILHKTKLTNLLVKNINFTKDMIIDEVLQGNYMANGYKNMKNIKNLKLYTNNDFNDTYELLLLSSSQLLSYLATKNITEKEQALNNFIEYLYKYMKSNKYHINEKGDLENQMQTFSEDLKNKDNIDTDNMRKQAAFIYISIIDSFINLLQDTLDEQYKDILPKKQ